MTPPPSFAVLLSAFTPAGAKIHQPIVSVAPPPTLPVPTASHTIRAVSSLSGLPYWLFRLNDQIRSHSRLGYEYITNMVAVMHDFTSASITAIATPLDYVTSLCNGQMQYMCHKVNMKAVSIRRALPPFRYNYFELPSDTTRVYVSILPTQTFLFSVV